MTRATVRDVARTAGVSLATVDRVLNGRSGVRAATIEKVENAIRALGFRRDMAAANLAKSRSYPILFVLPSGANSFMRMLEQDVASAARLADAIRATLSVKTVPPFDSAALAAGLDRIGPNDAAGVAVVATDAPIVRLAINDLVDRGVAVVTLVSDLPNSKRAHFVGIDNIAAGRTAASLLGRFVGPQGGKVGVVAGSMMLRDHAERRFGFEQVIRSEFPNVEILPLVEGRDEIAATAEGLAALIARHPDIAGVYSLGAGNRGVIEAVEAAGLAGRIRIIAHEITEHARRALIMGVFDAVLNQDTGHEIRSAVRVLQSLIDGAPIIAGQERIRIDIFTKDNLP